MSFSLVLVYEEESNKETRETIHLSLNREPRDILVCSLDNFLGAEVQLDWVSGNKVDGGPCRAQMWEEPVASLITWGLPLDSKEAAKAHKKEKPFTQSCTSERK